VGFSRRVRPYNGKIFQRRRRLRRAPFDAAELATKFIGARSWQQCKVRMVDLTLASEDYPMGQGCCSWHGGECGCQNGRDQCCDGTLSRAVHAQITAGRFQGPGRKHGTPAQMIRDNDPRLKGD
jgi:hypothetical protein